MSVDSIYLQPSKTM